eukprot:789277-Rhodomonas_salina.5
MQIRGGYDLPPAFAVGARLSAYPASCIMLRRSGIILRKSGIILRVCSTMLRRAGRGGAGGHKGQAVDEDVGIQLPPYPSSVPHTA